MSLISRSKSVGRVRDTLEELALAPSEVRIQHQFGHTDDPVHGRADLMAHVGEELALGPAGGLRGFFGLGQFSVMVDLPIPQSSGGRDPPTRPRTARSSLFRLLALGDIVH